MKKGFTLVELSIVLIIIGLIIGGVMKGKDLINSAEQKKIYNTWIKEWQLVVNTYQDRTGALLGDGTNNGGTTGTDGDGQFDTVNLSTSSTVQTKLKAIGLDVPAGNILSTNGGSYSIKGKYITNDAVMTLKWSATDSKNRLHISGMPTDVAIAFDKIADGTLNAVEGVFRWDSATATATWPDAEATATKTVDVMIEI